MSDGFAQVRQHSTLLRAWLQRWRTPPTNVSAEPPNATARFLFDLAYVAVGDADSARELTADVLARWPADVIAADQIERPAATRRLVGALPAGWLSWPGAAGPAEWLRLGVRREQADRLLSMLGERDPIDRMALLLHLKWDVRREDLDHWLGGSGMALRITELITYVGESMEFMPPANERAECAARAPDLFELHEPQLGRAARLHTIGCDTCADRARGIDATTRLLRTALGTFFRASAPAILSQRVALRRWQNWRGGILRWRPALYAALALFALTTLFRANASAPPSVTQKRAAPVTAAIVLDRAIARFAKPQFDGALHEMVRFRSRDQMLILDRWDEPNRKRVRVTVRAESSGAVLLDVASNGTDLGYAVTGQQRGLQSVLLRKPDLAALLPLLRTLPYTGNLSNSGIAQHNLDLTLLAEARRGRTTLLGTTAWQGRQAHLLRSVGATANMLLTIDADTSSLLQARLGVNDGSDQLSTVWEAQTIETLARSNVPWKQFEVNTRAKVLPLINPRQLGYSPLQPLDLQTALQMGPIVVPQALPEPSMLAYLRLRQREPVATMQVFEGQWSTVIIGAPLSMPALTTFVRDQPFTLGRYGTIAAAPPQTTIVEFDLNALPGTRFRLSVWHGLATDDERQALIIRLLDSLKLIDLDTIQARNQSVPHIVGDLAARKSRDLRAVAAPLHQ